VPLPHSQEFSSGNQTCATLTLKPRSEVEHQKVAGMPFTANDGGEWRRYTSDFGLKPCLSAICHAPRPPLACAIEYQNHWATAYLAIVIPLCRTFVFGWPSNRKPFTTCRTHHFHHIHRKDEYLRRFSTSTQNHKSFPQNPALPEIRLALLSRP